MEQQLTPAVVSTWFDDTEVLELTDQKLVLFSPSTFRKDMIVSRCAVYIQEALKDLFDMELELIVLDETQIDAYRSRKKKPRFIEFNPQFTFDNFIVGNSNKFGFAKDDTFDMNFATENVTIPFHKGASEYYAENGVNVATE